MGFDRALLPDPPAFYENTGLRLVGRGKWRTTSCAFHDGSDSMRINTESGAFVCMACGAKGGDVLAYYMQAHGLEFIDAAKALGAWIDDGRPATQHKPTALSPRAALEVLGFEAMLVAIEASRIASGMVPSEPDKARVLLSANRITRIMEAFA